MNEERAQDALRHLQTAAVEMIEATRAALEVVEDIVRDPTVVSSLLASVQAMAHTAAQAAQETSGDGGPGRADSSPSSSSGGASAKAPRGASTSRSRVTRIPVS